MGKRILSLLPFLREKESLKEGEEEERPTCLEILIEKKGYTYLVRIPRLRKKFYDISDRIQAPKAYLGNFLIQLAHNYSMDGGGILILTDKEP